MGKNIPKSAVGMKSGSKNKSVSSVQAYLKEFGYLQGETQPFAADDVYMRSSRRTLGRSEGIPTSTTPKDGLSISRLGPDSTW